MNIVKGIIQRHSPIYLIDVRLVSSFIQKHKIFIPIAMVLFLLFLVTGYFSLIIICDSIRVMFEFLQVSEGHLRALEDTNPLFILFSSAVWSFLPVIFMLSSCS